MKKPRKRIDPTHKRGMSPELCKQSENPSIDRKRCGKQWNISKNQQRKKRTIRNVLAKGQTSRGQIGVTDFMNCQLQSGPVKVFTREEIEAYEQQLLKERS